MSEDQTIIKLFLFKMIIKGEILELSELDKKIVELVAYHRQINKEKTGLNGLGTAANDQNHLYRNKIGFGAEYLFCKKTDIFPDFWIGNTSKIKGTDKYDAKLNGFSVDVKTSEKNIPLMTPFYSVSDCQIFAFFYCKYPKYRFEGFATNSMLFNQKNIKNVRVKSYVLEKKYLLDFKDLDLWQNMKF